MALPNSRQHAKDLVRNIAKNHGYLSYEFLQTIPPEQRREVEEALLSKDTLIGTSAIALAKNLYSSKARFVFELLQNADDNSYKKAAALRTVPVVWFHIHPDRIVLECNEDGFTSENLEAICSIGQSSKSGAQGYIGEKGIGFKSVFMAAWKVHIQSGELSFSFRHKSGDSGMGMISPVWEDPDEELPSPLTRITLYLLETGGPVLLAKARETIQQQFDELQETILLFLKNIQRIHVYFYDEGQTISSTTYSIDRSQENHATLTRLKTHNNTTQENIKHFHVTNYDATNLAKNDNRTYSATEEATRAYSISRIVLAFPLTAQSIPIVDPQDIFAFLPVRKAGFTFLIQADFVTNANRQDIVQDSIRNIGLLDGIAKAFVKAALQFYEHETLRYQWMRYLPDKQNRNWGSLWLRLVNEITLNVKKAPVLCDQKTNNRHALTDLLRIQPSLMDEDGAPLFDEDGPGQIISRSYSEADVDILCDYGLGYAKWHHIFKWIKDDLKRAGLSRMKSPFTADSWHLRAAKLLQTPFRNNWVKDMADLRMLDLIPLKNNIWVSSSFDPVYFQKIGDIEIPSGVNIQLLAKTVTLAHRIKLFELLGVKTAPVNLVRKKIFSRYLGGILGPSAPGVTLQISKEHLTFLYKTDHLNQEDQEYLSVPIYNQKSSIIHSIFGRRHMFVVNNEPYGPWEVFRKTDPGPNPGDGAPGLDVSFVNEEYFNNSPSTPENQELSWISWFHEKLGVERHVGFSIEPNGLNSHARYIQCHRPEKFMGCLLSWHSLSGQKLQDQLVDCLQDTEVLCRGNRKAFLQYTYFPTAELERRVERYVEQGAFFPWLWLDKQTIHDTIPPQWKDLLTQLSAGIPETDLEFALDMLIYSCEGLLEDSGPASIRKLLRLYIHIQTQYQDSEDRNHARELIRLIFSEAPYIIFPSGSGVGLDMAFPSDCVWSAPQDLETKHVLERLYQPFIASDGDFSSSLSHFFKKTLGISDCTWEIYIDELKELKASGCDNSDIIGNIYQALDSLRSGIPSTDEDQFKADFENEALIYVRSDGRESWHKVSQCVWSTATKLRDRVSLNDDYEDLEDLFVKFLGVKPVDLAMAIDELKQAGATSSALVPEVKESIWTVNSLLPTSANAPTSKVISGSRIFPIMHPDGNITLESRRTEFFIVDREPLRNSFRSKVKFLDFTLEEVAKLRPFFEWTQLMDRYLAYCVKEITSFHGGGDLPTTNPERQIYNRAHALLRVSVHFNSPRSSTGRDMESFYSVLRNARICSTKGISSDLHLSQDGISHVIQGERTTLHINGDQSGLKIYVPQDPDDQEYMFNNSLSRKLFDWMMTDPATQISQVITQSGVDATRDILLAPRSRLSRALEENGIVSVEVPKLDETVRLRTDEIQGSVSIGDQDDNDSDDNDSDAAWETASDASEGSSTAMSPSATEDAVIASRNHQLLPAYVQHSVSGRASITPTPSPVPFSAGLSVNEARYVALLSSVIARGRRDTIPIYDASNTSQSEADLHDSSHERDFGLRSVPQIERDCKIGAAGELYVFELLSHLSAPGNFQGSLPNFSAFNWQSTIRKYVTVHPEYAGMNPWSGRETSDIVYEDTGLNLTSILVSKGYIPEPWMGSRHPKYFIEVKTTTMRCETPFYMSKAQYQRMQANAIMENSGSLYVIFRVYNIGQPNMGLKIYVDPEALRLSRQLEFTAETWSVIPN